MAVAVVVAAAGANKGRQGSPVNERLNSSSEQNIDGGNGDYWSPTHSINKANTPPEPTQATPRDLRLCYDSAPASILLHARLYQLIPQLNPQP